MATWQECREYGLVKLDRGWVLVYYDNSSYKALQSHGEAIDAVWSGSGIIVTYKDGSKRRFSDFYRYDNI